MGAPNRKEAFFLFYNPSVSSADSSLYTREPNGRDDLGEGAFRTGGPLAVEGIHVASLLREVAKRSFDGRSFSLCCFSCVILFFPDSFSRLRRQLPQEGAFRDGGSGPREGAFRDGGSGPREGGYKDSFHRGKGRGFSAGRISLSLCRRGGGLSPGAPDRVVVVFAL